MLIQFPGAFLESESCLTRVDKMNVYTSFLTGISWETVEKRTAGQRSGRMRWIVDEGVAVLLWRVTSEVLWLEESVLLSQRDPTDSRVHLGRC